MISTQKKTRIGLRGSHKALLTKAEVLGAVIDLHQPYILKMFLVAEYRAKVNPGKSVVLFRWYTYD